MRNISNRSLSVCVCLFGNVSGNLSRFSSPPLPSSSSLSLLSLSLSLSLRPPLFLRHILKYTVCLHTTHTHTHTHTHTVLHWLCGIVCVLLLFNQCALLSVTCILISLFVVPNDCSLILFKACKINCARTHTHTHMLAWSHTLSPLLCFCTHTHTHTLKFDRLADIHVHVQTDSHVHLFRGWMPECVVLFLFWCFQTFRISYLISQGQALALLSLYSIFY